VHEFNSNRAIDAAFLALPGAGFTVDGPRAARDAARIDAGAKLALPRTLAVRELNGEFPIAAKLCGQRRAQKMPGSGPQAGMAISRNVGSASGSQGVMFSDHRSLRGQPRPERQAVISSVASTTATSRLSMLDGGKFTFRQERMLLSLRTPLRVGNWPGAADVGRAEHVRSAGYFRHHSVRYREASSTSMPRYLTVLKILVCREGAERLQVAGGAADQRCLRPP